MEAGGKKVAMKARGGLLAWREMFCILAILNASTWL